MTAGFGLGYTFGRRIIVGLAIIVLAPVSVWMITVFMRTYIAPPKVAAYRPAAIATPQPAAPEPMPTVLSARSIGSFPVAVASAGGLPAIEPARVDPTARDVRSAKDVGIDPVPLPPRRPRVLSAAARHPVPLPRPRPRQPL